MVLRSEQGCWMFDCGEGTQTQIMKSSVRPGRLNKIFITHLHGDHLFGLPGLLCTISQCASNSTSPSTINIYGPLGLRKFLRTAMHLSRSILGFQYCVHELLTDVHPAAFDGLEGWNPDYTATEILHPQEVLGADIKPNAQGFWDVCQEGSFRVHAGMLTHRIVCFGYVVIEDPLPGRLCVEKLKALGVPPGPLYARLKKGESITTSGGVAVDPADVVSPPRPGRKIVILGDTCESGHIVPLAMNADVVVHESTNQNCDGQKCKDNGHSTPAMAAEFCKLVSAGRLILTHFSQRYRNSGAALGADEKSVDILVEEARLALGSTNVEAAEDLKTFTIAAQKEN